MASQSDVIGYNEMGEGIDVAAQQWKEKLSTPLVMEEAT